MEKGKRETTHNPAAAGAPCGEPNYTRLAANRTTPNGNAANPPHTRPPTAPWRSLLNSVAYRSLNASTILQICAEIASRDDVMRSYFPQTSQTVYR